MRQTRREFEEGLLKYADQVHSVWTLMTDCNWKDAVGVAQVYGLCRKGRHYNAVSRHGSYTWLLYAHELGHTKPFLFPF